MRSPKALLAAICMTSAICSAAGCADARYFKIPANQPWPDEWVAGHRNPDHQKLALSSRTIRWHQRMDPLVLVARVDQLLRKRPKIYFYRRMEYAPNVRRDDESRAIPVVEVKLDATFLAMPKPPPLTIQWENQPFEKALRQLSVLLDLPIHLADDVPPQAPVNRYVRDRDPRRVLAELLLDRDLFFEPVLKAAREIRSFEYQSEEFFLGELRRAADRIETAYPDTGPLTVVKFDDWLRENRGPPRIAWQLDDQGEPQPVILNLDPDPHKAKIHLRWILRDKIR